MTRILEDKHILVGVTGGIAAYKAIEVVSRLRKLGAQVKVVMTENATHLASPLTFGEISGNPVAIDMWEEVHDWHVEHIALATWADAYLVVPTTANVLGKITHGIADDMLTTTIMAAPCPKFICPAMNTVMYENTVTQKNIETLRELGYHIMEPATGPLACGTEGIGRLQEPKDIIEWFLFQFLQDKTLVGTKIVISAGGTKEAIDPVRYIGNHSSGKMGYAIAKVAALKGATTYLVSTTKALPCPEGVELISVTSAREMEEAINRLYPDVDVVVMAAAVSDFRVAEQAENKIKKTDELTLHLVKNPDILQGLGKKKDRQILVGFAAETQDVIAYGKKKVEKKNLDLLVANDVSKSDAGFNVDTNEVTFIYKDGSTKDIANQSKDRIGQLIMDEIENLIDKENNS